MQKNYDILSNIVRTQPDHIYEKSNIAPHFQDFELSTLNIYSEFTESYTNNSYIM